MGGLDRGYPMSPVDFKKQQGPLSLSSLFPCRFKMAQCHHGRIKEIPYVVSVIFFLMSLGFTSLVDFKKWPCRPVEFKGHGP